MHKIIVVFITAILIITAPIHSLEGKEAIPKTKQKVEKRNKENPQKQTKQKKAPKYSKIPFALSGNTIPQNYLGHDLREVYKALQARLKKQMKSEFETTDELNKRIERENKLPLIGSITMVDNFALVVKAESTYDAHNKSLKILLPLEDPMEINMEIREHLEIKKKFELGIKGQEIYNSTRKYVGSNAFGATTNVTEFFRGNAVLAITNPYPSEDVINNITLDDVSVENAKKIKGNLSAICVFKVESPFIGEDGNFIEATIEHPVEMGTSNKLVYGRLSKIIVFNNKTGKILRRYANETEWHPGPTEPPTPLESDYETFYKETILDRRTGIMWAEKDNEEEINWIDANAYCENYREGDYKNWRLPTINELEELYKNGSYKKVKLNNVWIWSSDKKGDSTAYYFSFFSGKSSTNSMSSICGVLPVRDDK